MCARSVSREFRDKIAVSLSMFCVLQCIFMPFLVTLLPFLDFWWLSDEFLHPLLLIVVIPLTFLALFPGYFRHHNLKPLLIAIPALSLLIVGAFIGESMMEKFLTIGGAIILAAAHLFNIGLNRKIMHYASVSAM